MLLRNVHFPPSFRPVHISISGERIVTDVCDHAIEFQDAIAFPGLINSHDHLDFNLFPQLGKPPFADYIEWASKLHLEYRDEIDEVLNVPRALRIKWGIVKNILNGVTTVAEHGDATCTDAPITLIEPRNILHSPAFEKHWRWKLNSLGANGAPVVIHAGEGTSKRARREIDQLVRWNFLQRKIFVVHGVTITPLQARQIAALIWCPSSNQFMFNETANVQRVFSDVEVLFGTDSTLTATWNMWSTLRSARSLLPSEQLYATLTSNPAAAWGLKNCGHLNPGAVADVVVARKNGDGWTSFYDINPVDILLVIRRGRVILFDETIQDQLSEHISAGEDYSPLRLGHTVKLMIGNYGHIVEEVEAYLPGALSCLQNAAYAHS